MLGPGCCCPWGEWLSPSLSSPRFQVTNTPPLLKTQAHVLSPIPPQKQPHPAAVMGAPFPPPPPSAPLARAAEGEGSSPGAFAELSDSASIIDALSEGY